MVTPEEFETDLEALNFRFTGERMSTGVRQYSRQSSPYLTYWVHWDRRDDSILFTWEFAIGEYLGEIGMQIGSNEELNLFMYPRYDAKGEADIAFVVQEMDRAEALLGSVNFLEGT